MGRLMPEVDPYLQAVLIEAGYTGASLERIVRAYPTIQHLLDATLAEFGEVSQVNDLDPLFETLHRREHLFEAALIDPGPPPTAQELGQLVERLSAGAAARDRALTIGERLRFESGLERLTRESEGEV